MDQEMFSRKVENLRSQVDELVKQHASSSSLSPEQVSTREILEKFHNTLEELQVADEELRQQNIELAAARRIIEAERQRYQELFEFAPDGYLVTDWQGKILEANRAAANLFKIPQEFLVGKPLAIYVAKEGRENFYARLSLLKQHKETQEWELEIQPWNAPLFDASIRVAVANDIENGFGALRWLVRDIRESKRTQATLMDSEARFRMLAESISAAIFIVQDYKIRYVNPAASDVTGYTTEELIGREVAEVIYLPYREIFLEAGSRIKSMSPAPKRPGEPAASTKRNRQQIQLITKSSQDCWVDITLGDFLFEGRPAIIVTAYDITEQEKAKKDRQELLRQLVTIQEEERQRISRELHDYMGQGLTALILGLKSIEDMLPADSPAHKSLRHLKEIAGELGQEVHRLAFELRPASLDDLGLHTTLTNYAEEWSERAKIKVDYQATGLRDERFPSQIETTIYRIVQEALTNIVKHAQARNVSIILDRQPQQIQAIVEDDGCGFDYDRVMKAQGERRFGLIGMKERAELVGGKFNIESEMGKGTAIYVRIPCEPILPV